MPRRAGSASESAGSGRCCSRPRPTGDLVETGQFAIFPWFPPHDTDVSGLRWIAVMEHLITESPRVVVPGHNDINGPQLLCDVRDYLQLLRDETWRASGLGHERRHDCR